MAEYDIATGSTVSTEEGLQPVEPVEGPEIASSVSEDNKITISWVRHGESDANILEGIDTITDFYDFITPVGRDKKTNLNNKPNETKFKTTDFVDELVLPNKKREITETEKDLQQIRTDLTEFKKSENYKLFIKMQDDFKNYKVNYKLNKKLEDEINNNDEYVNPNIQMKPIKMCQDIEKFDINRWLKPEILNTDAEYRAYYKKNIITDFAKIGKPPSSWFYTPTLTYNGVRQAKLLGKEYLKDKIGSYDLILCSGTVRTIMTALFSICSAFGEDNGKRDTFFESNKLNIVPYINEKYNGSGEFDRANATVPPEIIDEVVDLIIDYCVDKNQNKLLDFPAKEILKNFINTTPYKEYIKTSGEELKKYSEGNYEKFISEFLPSFIGAKKNILAYSHGKNIDEDVRGELCDKDFRLAFFPNNCSVWQVDYNKFDNKYERDEKYSIEFNEEEKKPERDELVNKYSKNYVSRANYSEQAINITDLEAKGFPYPSYLGAFARRTDKDFEEEIEAVLKAREYWGRLSGNSLRDKINHLWINCYDNKCIKPDYTITWVRHGESISQLIEHANDDYPSLLILMENDYNDPAKTNIKKYEDKFNDYRKKVILNEIDNYSRFKDKLDLIYNDPKHNKAEDMTKYSNEQSKKLLDYDVFFPVYPNKYDKLKQDKLKDNWVLQNDVKTQNTDVWNLNTVFSKQISPSSWYFTPTLDSVGIMEAKKFGRDFLKDNIKSYDTLICSPTVRTIMTALFALDAAGISDKNIIIIPYINEGNITTKGIEERANIGIPVEILDRVIELITTFIQNDITTKNTFDTHYYEQEAETMNDATTKPYSIGGQFGEKGKKFIEDKIITPNNNKKILAFAHGYTIKDLVIYNDKIKVDRKYRDTQSLPFPYNCSTYEIEYSKNQQNGLKSREKYVNEFTQIRLKNDENHPDHGDNTNVKKNNYSSLASFCLRGKINDIWIFGDNKHIKKVGGHNRKTKRRGKITKNKKTKRRGKITKRRKHKKTNKRR